MKIVLLVAAALLIAAEAQAADQLAAQFDHPVAVKKVPPKSDDDPNGQITCTFYRDLMVRESGTDSPDPNDAMLIPIGGAARPGCDAAKHDGDMTLKTEGFSFMGRKANFLLFSATDSNGAIPFMVIDAANGKVIFQDGTPAEHGMQTVAVENGSLHLRYTRGFNASCSIMQDAAGCWSHLVSEGKIPSSMAQQVPASKLCAGSYKAARSPADNPSVISYPVDTVVDVSGHAQTTLRGPVACSPMP
jgi:hypothetical protein